MSVVFCLWKTPFLSSTHQKFSIPFLLRIETFWYECETQFSIDWIFVNYHSLISQKMIQYRYINITLTSLQASYVYLVDIYIFFGSCHGAWLWMELWAIEITRQSSFTSRLMSHRKDSYLFSVILPRTYIIMLSIFSMMTIRKTMVGFHLPSMTSSRSAQLMITIISSTLPLHAWLSSVPMRTSSHFSQG